MRWETYRYNLVGDLVQLRSELYQQSRVHYMSDFAVGEFGEKWKKRETKTLQKKRESDLLVKPYYLVKPSAANYSKSCTTVLQANQILDSTEGNLVVHFTATYAPPKRHPAVAFPTSSCSMMHLVIGLSCSPWLALTTSFWQVHLLLWSHLRLFP